MTPMLACSVSNRVTLVRERGTMPKRRKRKEKDADGDHNMATTTATASEWKTGPVGGDGMEGVESGGVEIPVARKKGEHMMKGAKRSAKRRKAKGISKALAVTDRITTQKSSRLSRRALRKSAKDLW